MNHLIERTKLLGVLTLAFTFERSQKLLANPTGLSVGAGSATVQQTGSQLNVAVGQTAILNWSSFNISAGETTSFLQPSANSVVFNIIGDHNASQIFGNLNAVGTVILANANGFYFGPNSMIKVGGSFIATTAPLTPDFGSGATWQFTGMPPLASIVNYGQVEVGAGKSLYLIAEKVENHGSLTAPQGDVELLAGDSVLVSERPDGRGLSATLNLPQGSVDNFGRITADAGTIALNAKVVNQDGILQADSVAQKNGTIELVASDQLNLGGDSQILARGDDSVAGSPGGTVVLKSENCFSDLTGSQIVTIAGVKGGNGGDVEVSAPNILSLDSAMDASAGSGFLSGQFLLDPVNIVLNSSGVTTSTPDGTGTINGAGATTATWNVNVNTAFKNKNFSQILLEASGNISLSSSLNWNLSSSTGKTSGRLVLLAAGDIVFGSNAKITDANDWAVTLEAGYNFDNQSIVKGTGNIYLNGGTGKTQNGSIQLATGDINLDAGASILVGTGYVRTTGGGNISVNTLQGDINCGTAYGGYIFDSTGYRVNTSVQGGIDTIAGGNVSLTAGNNIISIQASSSGVPGTSGALGADAGNVTLIAGNQVLGNYLVANGTGTIEAGVQVQDGQVTQILNLNASVGALPTTSSVQGAAPITLSLISGTWNVWSGGNIYVKEVNNPNGTYNPNELTVTPGRFLGDIGGDAVPTQSPFLFDYAANAAANFWAGNGITLDGNNLVRNSQDVGMKPVYAPILTLNAGAGGITINKSVYLYPSALGALHITTRDGGDLSGYVSAPNPNGTVDTTLRGITMSDSGSPDDWQVSFGGTHAITPWHLNDPNPVTLDISGSIESFSLNVPTYAQIKVTGNTFNFAFQGQNLSAAQTTSIQVGGSITYRGDFSSLTYAISSDPLPAFLFSSLLSGDADVANKLRYDATTGILSYIGAMSSTEENFLLNPTKVVLDAHGNPVYLPVLDANGNQVVDANGDPVPPVLQTTPVTLDAAQKQAVKDLFAASQTASLGGQGIAISGPGHLTVSAQTIDLGVSGGISALAPDAALAAISPLGADVSVTTLGNLSMTSSQIANYGYHGGVSVNVEGTLDIGSEFSLYGNQSVPKGIFSTSGGDVSVTAQGDVNVNGSRIAAYNGGNITVTSQTGDVNAGAGGQGDVSFTALELDPKTGELISLPAEIPLSGILATTVFGSDAALGNIVINAPQGNVNASLGGVMQISFNGSDTKNNFIQIGAAKDINATGSGVIGSNIKLKAGGNINGVVVGTDSVDISAQRNVDVTAVSGGNVNIDAVGSVSGTIIGGGDVNVIGDAIDAAVRGSAVSASGDTSAASIGVPTSNVAKENAEVADSATVVTTKSNSDEDDLKKKKKGIVLAQKVSRVTVLLPAKN